MPAVYHRRGLRFLYPENWTLSDSGSSRLPMEISLEAPSGGMWILHVFPHDTDGDQLVEQALSVLREQYTDLESSPIDQQFGSYQARGAEAFFFCLDFLIATRILAVQTDEYTFLVMTQAEDREFTATGNVFSAITTSLLHSGSGPVATT